MEEKLHVGPAKQNLQDALCSLESNWRSGEGGFGALLHLAKEQMEEVPLYF